MSYEAMNWETAGEGPHHERRLRDLVVLMVVFGVTFAAFGLMSFIG